MVAPISPPPSKESTLPQYQDGPRLSDFGIGVLTDRSQLERHNITMTGMTQTSTSGAEYQQMGEGIYGPPERFCDARTSSSIAERSDGKVRTQIQKQPG